MKTFSEAQAAELIKTALASDTIKLLGSTTTDTDSAKRRAEADATYLLTLYSQLTAQQPAK